MPKKAAELGPLQVSRLKGRGLHPVGRVAGLRLQVSSSGARSWILRTTIGGKRSGKGLGGYPDATLAGARDAARAVRAKITAGVDPIAESRSARSALKAAVALPHVLGVLRPIWQTKTETASRVRARLEAVLDWASTCGYRDGLNPARWKGHLDNLLPAPTKVAKVAHHATLPVGAMGKFMRELRKHEGIGARALEFAILTAARSGEVRRATWSEIDMEAPMWTIPGLRMKMGREHRVPLSRPALDLLRALPRLADVDTEFAAPCGGQLSDMTLIRHDVSADVSIETTDIDVVDAMLSHAADLRTDLIVMGAYGHTRSSHVQDGTTRGLLAAISVPVLFSH